MEFSTDVKKVLSNHGFLQHVCQEDHSTSYYLPLDPRLAGEIITSSPKFDIFLGVLQQIMACQASPILVMPGKTGDEA